MLSHSHTTLSVIFLGKKMEDATREHILVTLKDTNVDRASLWVVFIIRNSEVIRHSSFLLSTILRPN